MKITKFALLLFTLFIIDTTSDFSRSYSPYKPWSLRKQLKEKSNIEKLRIKNSLKAKFIFDRIWVLVGFKYREIAAIIHASQNMITVPNTKLNAMCLA